MESPEVILDVKNVSIQFGGLRAIDNVSFQVSEAEIFGLIGPNGAGKTTMFNIITANYRATSGEVVLAGKPLTGLKPNQVVARGIARTFQNIRLFNSMTVLENVMIGLDRTSRYSLAEAALRIGRFFRQSARPATKQWHCWIISELLTLPVCRPLTSVMVTSVK